MFKSIRYKDEYYDLMHNGSFNGKSEEEMEQIRSYYEDGYDIFTDEIIEKWMEDINEQWKKSPKHGKLISEMEDKLAKKELDYKQVISIMMDNGINVRIIHSRIKYWAVKYNIELENEL